MTVILFDGVCNLCNGWARFVIRHDRRRCFRLAAMQTPAGAALLERHGLGKRVGESVVLIEEGSAFTRSSAVLRMLRRLPFPWSLAVVGWIVPRPLRDALYDWVAHNRYRWFGRREICMVPNPREADRFL